MDSSDKFHSLEPFFQGLTHEIRNPVQGILASAEALQSILNEEGTTHKLLEMIHRECIRIDQLLRDLLELVRPVQLDDQPQFVQKILEESIRDIQQARTSLCKIEYEIEDLPAIFMDGASLRRAFMAILRNSTESRTDTVEILVRALRKKEMLQIEFHDNGEGISAENLDRILEPFFSSRPKKAGLGLTMADRAVKLHGGELKIKSKPGTGTEVRILLPIER